MPKKHTIIYYKAFDVPMTQDFRVPSEISGADAVDIHHIVNREDRIENLMAVTRQEHLDVGEKKELTYNLLLLHRNYLKQHNIDFDNSWFEQYLKQYKPFSK